MKGIENDGNVPESGPQSFWEFLDKWLHKLLVHYGERLVPVVKFALIGGAVIYVALVVWRIWLIQHALTTFGVDIIGVLPVDPNTAALIHTGLSILALFAPDAIIAYVLFNRHVQYWRAWTAVALVCAVGASWWATHEPGLGTHCYVVTPDRGLIEKYADMNGQCGLDRPSGLQMRPVTKDILLSIRAMKRGISPHRLTVSAINAAEMFDAGDGHSLYWFHQDAANGFDFYDGPGFDQATLTPLEPVTHQNAEKIRQYIKQQHEIEHAAKEKAERETKETEREEKKAALAAIDARDKALAESARLALQEKENRKKLEMQRIESQRVAALKSLINCSAGATTALAIKPASQSSDSETTTNMAEQLASAARASSVTIATNFFRPKFFSEGYFERAYGGDIELLREIGTFACVNTVLLAQIRTSCGQLVDGVTSCDLRLIYQVLNRSGRTLDSGSVATTGPGFDKRDALQNGTKRLIETKSSQILRSIKGG